MPNYPPCDYCGSEKILNPKTGKVFCKAKCWLNKQSKATPNTQKAPSQPSLDEKTILLRDISNSLKILISEIRGAVQVFGNGEKSKDEINIKKLDL